MLLEVVLARAAQTFSEVASRPKMNECIGLGFFLRVKTVKRCLIVPRPHVNMK